MCWRKECSGCPLTHGPRSNVRHRDHYLVKRANESAHVASPPSVCVTGGANRSAHAVRARGSPAFASSVAPLQRFLQAEPAMSARNWLRRGPRQMRARQLDGVTLRGFRAGELHLHVDDPLVRGQDFGIDTGNAPC